MSTEQIMALQLFYHAAQVIVPLCLVLLMPVLISMYLEWRNEASFAQSQIVWTPQGFALARVQVLTSQSYATARMMQVAW